MCFSRSNSRGFTLIELMIVVVIIGILAAMAIPRFMAASTKSKQSEAKLVLKQIYVNQRAYRQQGLVNEYFITDQTASTENPQAFGTIWVEIMTTANYEYTIEGDANSFTATASGNLDDDEAIDVWTINQDGDIINVTNDAIEDEAA